MLIQHNNRFFPVGGDAYGATAPALFSFAVGGSDINHLDVIYLFDRMFDLGFVGPGMHLKRIGIQGLGLVRTLFGN